MARAWIKLLHNLGRFIILVLDGGNGAGEGQAVAFEHFFCNIQVSPSLEDVISLISLV